MEAITCNGVPLERVVTGNNYSTSFIFTNGAKPMEGKRLVNALQLAIQSGKRAACYVNGTLVCDSRMDIPGGYVSQLKCFAVSYRENEWVRGMQLHAECAIWADTIEQATADWQSKYPNTTILGIRQGYPCL